MKTFHEFYDGFVDGVLLDGSTVFLFLSTSSRERFVMKLSDVLSLKMNDFREGNILFDVILREGDEIVEQDIEELFGFNDSSKAVKKLAETHNEEFVVVEVNPSYGATLLAIVTNVRMMTRKDWLDELLTTKESLRS